MSSSAIAVGINLSSALFLRVTDVQQRVHNNSCFPLSLIGSLSQVSRYSQIKSGTTVVLAFFTLDKSVGGWQNIVILYLLAWKRIK